MTALRIIHFSDIHTGGHAEDFGAYFDKRIVGVFNYCFRRKFLHDMSILEKFVDEVLANPPDLLVCTGDLTSTSQVGEFDEAIRHLQRLIDAKIPMLYLPGNHDFYTKSEKCIQKMKKVFETLNAYFDLQFDALPQLVTLKNYRFLLVNEAYPTALVSSCGYLKRQDRAFIFEVLKNHDVHPIIVGHYPLIEEKPLLRIRHRLWGQDSILSSLLDGKIMLSLNGHIHAPYVRMYEGRPVECCASSLTKTGHFAEIILDSPHEKPRITHYKISAGSCMPVCVEQKNMSHLK